MNSYEAKQAARKQRQAERAAKLHDEAKQIHDQARRMASVIPFGQPILVGHHSEGRDRRYRERIHNTFGKAFALEDRANELDRRASTVSTAISSDDEDAIRKLEAKLAKLEDRQAMMKAANKLVRRKDLAGLAEMIGEAAARKLMEPDFCGRVGFPGYALQNNNAEIRRIKARIGGMKARENATPASDIEGDGFTIREDAEDNRIWVIFEQKPPRETCQIMRRCGFKWSPSRSAWVRMLNANGRFAASCVAKALSEN